MLTLFQARNTVVWLPSLFKSSKLNAIIAMLLLVASCVDLIAHFLYIQYSTTYSA